MLRPAMQPKRLRYSETVMQSQPPGRGNEGIANDLGQALAARAQVAKRVSWPAGEVGPGFPWTWLAIYYSQAPRVSRERRDEVEQAKNVRHNWSFAPQQFPIDLAGEMLRETDDIGNPDQPDSGRDVRVEDEVPAEMP